MSVFPKRPGESSTSSESSVVTDATLAKQELYIAGGAVIPTYGQPILNNVNGTLSLSRMQSYQNVDNVFCHIMPPPDANLQIRGSWILRSANGTTSTGGCINSTAYYVNSTACQAYQSVQYDTYTGIHYVITESSAGAPGLLYANSGGATLSSIMQATPSAFAYNETLQHSVIATYASTISHEIWRSSSCNGTYTKATKSTLPARVTGFACTPTKTFAFCEGFAEASNGVIQTSDGLTWTAAPPLPTTNGTGVSVYRGTYIDGVLWLFTSKGLAKTSDNGVTWIFVNTDGVAPGGYVFKGNGYMLYLGADVRISRDSGETWVTQPWAVPIYLQYGSVYFDPTTDLLWGTSTAAAICTNVLSGEKALNLPISEIQYVSLATASSQYTYLRQVAPSISLDGSDYVVFMGTKNTTPFEIGWSQVILPYLSVSEETTYMVTAVGGGGSGQFATGDSTLLPTANGTPTKLGTVVVAAGALAAENLQPSNGYRAGKLSPTPVNGSYAIAPGGPGYILNGEAAGKGGDSATMVASTSSAGSGFVAKGEVVLKPGRYYIVIGAGGKRLTGPLYQLCGADGAILIKEK